MISCAFAMQNYAQRVNFANILCFFRRFLHRIWLFVQVYRTKHIVFAICQASISAYCAWSSMKTRRGSTSSPMSMEKM